MLSCIEIICSEKCTNINDDTSNDNTDNDDTDDDDDGDGTGVNDDNTNAAIFVASASLRSNVATEWSRSFKIIVVAAKWFVSNVAAATI